MSDIIEFKSDRDAAKQVGQKLAEVAQNLAMSAPQIVVRSNLTIVDNISNVFRELQACNEDFIKMLDKDENHIDGLQEAFENLDMNLSTKMEGQ